MGLCSHDEATPAARSHRIDADRELPCSPFCDVEGSYAADCSDRAQWQRQVYHIDVFNFLSECFQSGLRSAWERRGRARELKTRGKRGPVVIDSATAKGLPHT